MKRNTALRLTAWIGIFVTSVTPFGSRMFYPVLAAVAHQKYGLDMSTTDGALLQFAQAQPDAQNIASLIFLAILIVLSILIGAILVTLFGEPKHPSL